MGIGAIRGGGRVRGGSGELDGPGFGLLRRRFAAWEGIVWDYWWAWLIFCGRGLLWESFFSGQSGNPGVGINQRGGRSQCWATGGGSLRRGLKPYIGW